MIRSAGKRSGIAKDDDRTLLQQWQPLLSTVERQ
jgi:hypothetical protein